MHPQHTILLVDDSPENLQILNEVLKDSYRIKVATSGERALALAGGDEPPDLILLDVMMPGMDGYEVCSRLKNDPKTHAIPVLFVSSRDEEEDEERGLALGAIDYIVKPVRPSIVRARVRNHIELKRSRDLLERLTTLDHLTGIGNRRRYDEYLETEWRRAAREQAPIALIAIDIDHFKAYNDHYGHPRGDQCLAVVAQALAATVTRPSDLVARCGGEEFGCILPGTDIAGALHIAEEMLRNVVGLNLEHARSPTRPCVSISLGVAALVPKADEPPGALPELADAALYQAKADGRCRCVTKQR
ncbi:MAG: diguanylate cyclase [Rhodocyclaceae bacterium]|jgi:diguanylate cyclase (GGDEF)-like protein|nr:diguanylate cyclase [Rhodocyclaceae bacterium]MCC6880123.1 diguanylate cyclase [Rhodocyclaceae bacterium]MCL4681120.1 diguanylate cyclase [Rhodocyclaceae bacterium]